MGASSNVKGALNKTLAVLGEGAALGVGIGAAEHVLNKTLQGKNKKAMLDQALGNLYRAYGPPLQKHAAAEFFFYELESERREQQALGQKFCKLASASNMDPWQMAKKVVDRLEDFEKMATTTGPTAEIAKFYVDWSNGIIKQAAIAGMIGRGVAKLKNTFGIGRSTMQMPAQQAVHAQQAKAMQGTAAATKQRLIAQRTAAGQPMPSSMQRAVPKQQRQNMAAQEMKRRGQISVPAKPSITDVRAAQATAAPAPVRGTVRPLPEPSAAPAASAPNTAPRQVPMEQPAAPAAAQSGPSRADMLRGAAVVGGLGLGGSMLMGGGEQPAQPGGY